MIWVGYRRDQESARAVLEDDEAFDARLESEDNDETSVDLNQAWYGIHRLLTGSAVETADITSQAIFGGEPIGPDDGYGPPRLLAADDVRAMSQALQDVTPETLRSRTDPEAMERADLDPTVWDDPDEFEAFLLPALTPPHVLCDRRGRRRRGVRRR